MIFKFILKDFHAELRCNVCVFIALNLVHITDSLRHWCQREVKKNLNPET